MNFDVPSRLRPCSVSCKPHILLELSNHIDRIGEDSLVPVHHLRIDPEPAGDFCGLEATTKLPQGERVPQPE